MQFAMQYLEMELKYCERCGALHLRQQGSSRIYCESCEEEMAKVYQARPAGRERYARNGRGRKSSENLQKKPCRAAVSLAETTGANNRDDRRCL